MRWAHVLGTRSSGCPTSFITFDYTPTNTSRVNRCSNAAWDRISPTRSTAVGAALDRDRRDLSLSRPGARHEPDRASQLRTGSSAESQDQARRGGCVSFGGFISIRSHREHGPYESIHVNAAEVFHRAGPRQANAGAFFLSKAASYLIAVNRILRPSTEHRRRIVRSPNTSCILCLVSASLGRYEWGALPRQVPWSDRMAIRSRPGLILNSGIGEPLPVHGGA